MGMGDRFRVWGDFLNIGICFHLLNYKKGILENFGQQRNDYMVISLIAIILLKEKTGC